MPSHEFHRRFPIGRTIVVSTFRMRSVVPIRVGSNQSMMSKYYPITTRLRKLLTLPPPSMRTACELLANCCSRRRTELEIFNIQSEKQQQRDDDLRSPLMSAVHANCWRTANLLFMEFEIFSRIQSEQQQERAGRQFTTVRANCL